MVAEVENNLGKKREELTDVSPEEVIIETVSTTRLEERHDVIERTDFKASNANKLRPDECSLNMFTGTGPDQKEITGIVKRKSEAPELVMAHETRIIRRQKVLVTDEQVFKRQAEIIFEHHAQKNASLLGQEIGDKYVGDIMFHWFANV